ncbi:MAG: aldo/keto reductase family protein [Planctomycetota bacterium]|jgi:voltage-dependent potassium channel beta subunit
MEYRRLGRHGIHVSAISLGGWTTFGKSLEVEESRAVIRTAFDAGIQFLDLADVYARGRAEEVAGEILRDYRREELVVSSKVFWPMGDGPNDRGLGRKHIVESVERSLARLQLDYLDLYFCHRYDPDTPLDETIDAMDDLVRRGRILYWGTSVWEADQLRTATDLARERHRTGPAVEQPRYNCIDRHIEAEILPTCEELGIGLVLWSPLAQGLLSGKYSGGIPAQSRGSQDGWLDATLTERNLAAVRRFDALAREAGTTPAALALAWLLRRPAVSSAIIGATRPEQVTENLRALEVTIDDGLAGAIESCFEGCELP